MAAGKTYNDKVFYCPPDENGEHTIKRPAKVKRIEGSLIKIMEDDGTTHNLSFPSCFFKNNKGPHMIACGSNISLRVKEETKDHVCELCGEYESYVITKTNGRLLCKKCIEQTKEEYERCFQCGNTSAKKAGRFNDAGLFFCNSCYEKRQKRRVIDIYNHEFEPYITINLREPVSCKSHYEEVENVRGLVKFSNNSVHEMDLLYCKSCNRIICLFNILQIYEDRFGTCVFERRFGEDVKEYFKSFKRSDNNYADDTLLSRWGYIAQLEKQTTAERRLILRYILSAEKNNKKEIISILNRFINTRGERCRYALPLWREDLLFVSDFDVGESVIDLTDDNIIVR